MKNQIDFWYKWAKLELDNGYNVGFSSQGWSMFPNICRGATLEIKKIAIEDLKVGNLVAFVRKEKVVLHRLVIKQKIDDYWHLQTQGDSNTRLDLPFDESQFLGIIVAINGNQTHRALRTDRKINHKFNSIIKGLLIFFATPYRVGRRLTRRIKFMRR